jgi:hypothetical protein
MMVFEVFPGGSVDFSFGALRKYAPNEKICQVFWQGNPLYGAAERTSAAIVNKNLVIC